MQILYVLIDDGRGAAHEIRHGGGQRVVPGDHRRGVLLPALVAGGMCLPPSLTKPGFSVSFHYTITSGWGISIIFFTAAQWIVDVISGLHTAEAPRYAHSLPPPFTHQSRVPCLASHDNAGTSAHCVGRPVVHGIYRGGCGQSWRSTETGKIHIRDQIHGDNPSWVF